MKKLKRQPNIKLKDIQEAVHDKYTLNISAGKESKVAKAIVLKGSQGNL